MANRAPLNPEMPPSLVLVVPCFNEARRLDPQAFAAFAAARPGVRLLFVDDGSTDATPAILERIRSASPASVDLVRLAANQGKAAAVREGILAGLRLDPGLVGFWDADLSTPLAAIDDFLALAARRPDIDIILGSRVMLMGRDIRREAWRHYMGRVFATGVSLSLDLPVYDTQCGAKVFRANDATAAVFAAPFHSPWIFDVEVLARYLALPAAPGEPARRDRNYELTVPVWHHVRGSKLRWTDFVRAAWELVYIHRAYRR
jgi:glycosyltransferase involved in cell wall biosynthesis